MRPLTAVFSLVLMCLLAAFAVPAGAQEGKLLMTSAPGTARTFENPLKVLKDKGTRLAGTCYACGLCSDTDCCGGSANGWKLCSCGDGTSKCCKDVATCP